jgi:hypothetical protein
MCLAPDGYTAQEAQWTGPPYTADLLKLFSVLEHPELTSHDTRLASDVGVLNPLNAELNPICYLLAL